METTKTQQLGVLYVVAAPSGAGKTTIVNALLQQDRQIKVSISHTTRPIRPGERDKQNYFFVEAGEFKRLVDKNHFIEHAHVFNHYYGTSKAWVTEKLTAGYDVLLEIDWQGAEQIRRAMPECVTIFIMPPSVASLEERLQRRAQDNPETIADRMAKAKNEMSHCYSFDYLVINDDFDTAVADIQAIIHAARLKTYRQKVLYADLLAKLLA